MMITMLVTYAGDEQALLDRDLRVIVTSQFDEAGLGLAISRQPASDPAHSSHPSSRK
ncbi:hypothetical protein [Roseomonas indoligenes]|uniref:Uncharacterized protein n=1 Tax=Roseomonas indoligenes TaxID=2820811 RepID=A0A940S9A6_9PROT|nr:hypothetical protein [Pararoseomonas indoligenes]MBP0495058.1 hypothetical protein [Pararoseomonas indoligenes]